MTIKTTVLDRAAFLCCFGGKVLKIEGKAPDNTFTIEIEEWLRGYEKVGVVAYKKFCNMRKRLKEKTRKASGVPAHYMAKTKGPLLKDVAKITYW